MPFTRSKPVKKILFPLAFSSEASEVFKYAIDIASAFKARLVVMCAIKVPENKAKTETLINNEVAIASEKMIDFVTDHLEEDYNAVKIDYLVEVISPAKAILKAALDEDIDLIVMGMTEKANVQKFLMGKTAREVFAKSECPILLIPGSAKFRGINNLVYTVNFEFRDLGAINYLEKWAKVFKAAIHCLHVFEEDENEFKVIKSMNILKDTYKQQKALFFDQREGEFVKAIEDFASQKKADILTLITHKRNFISNLLQYSSVNGIIKKTSIPILLIKDNAYEINNESEEWLRLFNHFA